MDIHDLTRELQQKNESKIVMFVADGLGGLPMTPGGKTELESANVPNLNRLAALGVQGASIPVKPGIAPEADLDTWGCSVTIHSNIQSVVALSSDRNWAEPAIE